MLGWENAMGFAAKYCEIKHGFPGTCLGMRINQDCLFPCAINIPVHPGISITTVVYHVEAVFSPPWRNR